MFKMCDRSVQHLTKLLRILHSIQRIFGKNLFQELLYCKEHRTNTEWKMVKAKASVRPFYGPELTFSGPTSFKLEASELIIGGKICLDTLLDVILCYQYLWFRYIQFIQSLSYQAYSLYVTIITHRIIFTQYYFLYKIRYSVTIGIP